MAQAPRLLRQDKSTGIVLIRLIGIAYKVGFGKSVPDSQEIQATIVSSWKD